MHTLSHLIRNCAEKIDHAGDEQQHGHLIGQWDICSKKGMVHKNQQDGGSRCYLHLQSMLFGFKIHQLCGMSTQMSWDPGGFHGNGI